MRKFVQTEKKNLRKEDFRKEKNTLKEKDSGTDQTKISNQKENRQ